MIDSDNHSGLSDGNIVAYDDTDDGADDDDKPADAATPAELPEGPRTKSWW